MQAQSYSSAISFNLKNQGMSALNLGHECTKKGVDMHKTADSGLRAVDMDGICDYLRAIHGAAVEREVAKQSAIPPATIKNWFSKKSSISAAHLLTLVSIYGFAVMQAAYGDAAPKFMDDVINFEEIQALKKQQEAISARIAELEGS